MANEVVTVMVPKHFKDEDGTEVSGGLLHNVPAAKAEAWAKAGRIEPLDAAVPAPVVKTFSKPKEDVKPEAVTPTV